MITKTLDSRGRVCLGPQFANHLVTIDDSDPDEIKIYRAVAIPVKESWLHRNEQAMTSLQRGLTQAANGEFSDDPPDTESDTESDAEMFNDFEFED